MSWISNGWKAVKKGVSDTGHAIGDAANNPWVKAGTAAALAATGVGAPAAAAIMAGEGLAGGALSRHGTLANGVGQAVKSGGAGALAGAAGKALSGVPGMPDLSGIGDSIGNAVGSIPGAGAVATAASKVQDILKAHPELSGVPGIAQKLSSFIQQHGDTMLGLGAGAATVADQARARALQNEGMGIARSTWNQKAPLRAAGTAQMLNQQAPNLSNVFRSQGNPFARPPVNTPTPPRTVPPMPPASGGAGAQGPTGFGPLDKALGAPHPFPRPVTQPGGGIHSGYGPGAAPSMPPAMPVSAMQGMQGPQGPQDPSLLKQPRPFGTAMPASQAY